MRIKKTSEVIATTGNIIDSLAGNSTTNAPSINAVNNALNEISSSTNFQLTEASSDIQQHWGKYKKNLKRADVYIQGTFKTGDIITSGMPFSTEFAQYCSTEFGIFKFNTNGKITLINGTSAWGQVILTFFEV